MGRFGILEVESFKILYGSQVKENKESQEGDYKDVVLSSKGITEPMNQVERENKDKENKAKSLLENSFSEDTKVIRKRERY